MADDNTTNDAQAHDQPPQPNPALKRLDVMVGTWNISGPEITGQVTFEWIEGGFYLVQRIDFDRIGRRITGVEYIGYDEDDKVLKSYVFSNEESFGPSGGIAPEYVWEVGEGTLTIWFGDVGSPARFKGKFSDDGSTCAGGWEWPGGGYEATMTRAR